jgi:hypothetical protein
MKQAGIGYTIVEKSEEKTIGSITIAGPDPRAGGVWRGRVKFIGKPASSLAAYPEYAIEDEVLVLGGSIDFKPEMVGRTLHAVKHEAIVAVL